MPSHRLFAFALSLSMLACNSGSSGGTQANAPFTPANPFATASTLPFEAPLFDKIKDADYQPALSEGMRVQLDEVHAIAADTSAPTFDNTIVALERSGRLLSRTANAFFALTQANTNDTLQKVEEEMTPLLAAHTDAIHLNDTLFKRVKSVYDRRASLRSTPDRSSSSSATIAISCAPAPRSPMPTRPSCACSIRRRRHSRRTSRTTSSPRRRPADSSSATRRNSTA